MTHVVTENCIRCKYTDCVEVCPVDCFYEAKNMLVINPNECIDCGVCVSECPAEAIQPESEKLLKWLKINKDLSDISPVITKKKKSLEDADKYNGMQDKYDLYFKENELL